MPMYSDKVMEHFMKPRNVGEIENADGVGEIGNPTCGDMMTFMITVEDDKLVDIKFKTFGCGAAIVIALAPVLFMSVSIMPAAPHESVWKGTPASLQIAANSSTG